MNISRHNNEKINNISKCLHIKNFENYNYKNYKNF